MKKCFLFPLILLITSCSLSEGLEKVDTAVETFHGQMAAGFYQEIYQESAQGMKDAITVEEFISLFKSFQSTLGKVVSSSRINFSFKSTIATGTTYTVVYDTQFKNGTGRETFVFHEEGEVLRLLNYNLNSNDYIRMLREKAEI